MLCLTALATGAFAQSTPSHYFTASASALAVEDSTSAPAPSEAAVFGPAAPLPQKLQSLRHRSPLAPIVLPTATVLRLKLDGPLSTAGAKPGEQFTATLARPVEVDGRVILAAGSSVGCRIERAHTPRRFAGKPSLSIKAIRASTTSGEELNFTASVVDTSNPRHLDVDQEGTVHGVSPNPMNKVEMGSLTASGAVAGTIIAGPEGLLIGTAGGAVLAAGHMVIKRRDLTLAAGTELIFELDAPASISRPQMGGMQ
jgi:hypothetical protein